MDEMDELDEGMRLDIQFIRKERGLGNPHEVLRRATEVLTRLEPGNDGHDETLMHYSWASGLTEPFDETRIAYDSALRLIANEPTVTFVQLLCDYAVWLHRNGKSTESAAALGQAMDLARSSHNSQLHQICATAGAEIMTTQRDSPR